MLYFIACGLSLIAPCNAQEASLTAATLTAAEKSAGYHVVMVDGDEIVDVEGYFDEIS